MLLARKFFVGKSVFVPPTGPGIVLFALNSSQPHKFDLSTDTVSAGTNWTIASLVNTTAGAGNSVSAIFMDGQGSPGSNKSLRYGYAGDTTGLGANFTDVGFSGRGYGMGNATIGIFGVFPQTSAPFTGTLNNKYTWAADTAVVGGGTSAAIGVRATAIGTSTKGVVIAPSTTTTVLTYEYDYSSDTSASGTSITRASAGNQANISLTQASVGIVGHDATTADVKRYTFAGSTVAASASTPPTALIRNQGGGNDVRGIFNGNASSVEYTYASDVFASSTVLPVSASDATATSSYNPGVNL